MALPTLRQLRTLVATVDSGSVSAAARLLNVTQPAVSQQLRELDRTFGVRLLDRASGRIIATAAGEAVLAHARAAQAAVDAALAAASAYRHGGTGRVRLGTGASACIYLLPPVLEDVRRVMPGIEIIVATGNSADIMRSVETGALDVGLVTLPTPAASALAVTRLLDDALLAVVPDAMMPGSGAMTPARLARLPLVLYEPGGSTRAIVDAWFRRAGLAAKPVMELGNVEAIKVLAGGGLGATLLPSLALREPVAGATVRPVRPRLSRTLGIAVRREKVRDRALRAVLNALEALAATRL